MQNQIYEELLGLPQLQVNAVSVSAERIDINCESKFKACHCPVCLEPTTKINQCYERTVRDLPISGRRVSLHLRTWICAPFFEPFGWLISAKTPRRYCLL